MQLIIILKKRERCKNRREKRSRSEPGTYKLDFFYSLSQLSVLAMILLVLSTSSDAEFESSLGRDRMEILRVGGAWRGIVGHDGGNEQPLAGVPDSLFDKLVLSYCLFRLIASGPSPNGAHTLPRRC